MKKTVTLILVLALVISLAAGCKTAETPASGTPTPTKSAATNTPGAEPVENGMLENAPGYKTSDVLGSLAMHGDVPPTRLPLTDAKVTFTWWYAPGALTDAAMETFNDGEMWVEAEKRTGVHIEWHHPSATGIAEAFNLMIASDMLPDLIENRTNYAALGSLDNAVELGYFTDLVPYLDDFLPHVKGIIDANPTLKRTAYTDNGYLPGAPGLIQEDNIRVGTSLALRYDLLESKGYSTDMPVTFDDLRDMLVFFRDSADMPGALGLDPKGTFTGNMMLSGLGISSDYMLVDGKVIYCRTTGEYRFYLETMRDWYAENLIYTDFYTKTSWFEMVQGPMARDEMAVCAMWPAYTADALAKMVGNDAMFLKAFKDPVVGAKANNKWLASANTDHMRSMANACTAISTQCKDVELACKYLDYWYSAEGALLSNYGCRETTGDLENGTYYYDETGRPRLTSWMLGHTGEYSLATALTKYAMQLAMYEIVDHVTDGYTEGLRFANKDLMDLYGKDLDTLVNKEGRIPDGATMTSDESTAYAAKYNDISTFVNETTLMFIIGTKDLDDTTWTSYVQQIDSLGIADCVALKQATVDRYNAK